MIGTAFEIALTIPLVLLFLVLFYWALVWSAIAIFFVAEFWEKFVFAAAFALIIWGFASSHS